MGRKSVARRRIERKVGLTYLRHCGLDPQSIRRLRNTLFTSEFTKVSVEYCRERLNLLLCFSQRIVFSVVSAVYFFLFNNSYLIYSSGNQFY